MTSAPLIDIGLGGGDARRLRGVHVFCTHGVVRLIEVVRVKMIPWRQVKAGGEFSGG